MGGDRNTVHLLIRQGDDVHEEAWPVMGKSDVATALIARIAETIGNKDA